MLNGFNTAYDTNKVFERSFLDTVTKQTVLYTNAQSISGLILIQRYSHKANINL